MNNIFAQNLNKLMEQLDIQNAQLAKALNVDPSLVCRWRKEGCGKRSAPGHAIAIERFVLSRNMTAENRAWLSAQIGKPVFFGMPSGGIAVWLCPNADFQTQVNAGEDFPNLLLVDSFRSSVDSSSTYSVYDNNPVFSACDGTEKIAEYLQQEFSKLETDTIVNIYLNSESSSVAVDKKILSVLRNAVEDNKITINMLVESANNSSMASRLISAYMPLLVQGKLKLSVIQGIPQTFTITMNIVISNRATIIITEAVQPRCSAVGTMIHDLAIVRDMTDSFENSKRFARPMMTAYDDSFARNIIEVFFEEYGIPGSLDVIKSGLNPLYMTVEDYGRVLREFNHPDDQYKWRYDEFARFKVAMDEVLKNSRFREILSLTKLREIVNTGRCRMPSMYFFDAGIWYLDAQDCVNILDGYIHYLETNPNFHVVLLEDEQLFMPNSCWHIKNNKHVMIHSWNIDKPVMVYSDQLMLIDEFQRHFDSLWSQTDIYGSKRHVIGELITLRNQCAKHLNS